MAELKETAAKRQAAEDILRYCEWHLQLTLAAAELGSWRYDPGRGALSGNARSKEILDFPGNELRIDALMEQVHPDDAERIAAAFVGSLDPANTKRPVTEMRLRHRDGKFHWLETLGLVHFEGKRDVFHVSWTECDGPPVSAPNRRGFGTIVMAGRSVGGEVKLDYAPLGLTWCLICPAANVLEPSKRDEQNSIDRKSGLNAAAE